MQPLIAPLNPGDLNCAVDIYTRAFNAPSQGPHVQTFREFYSVYPDNWLIAYFNGVPAAVVAAFEYDRYVYVGYMAVLPEYQKKGIGKTLMNIIIEKYKGRKDILLDASAPGFPLYKQLGFIEKDKAVFFSIDKLSSPFYSSNDYRIEPVRPCHYAQIMELDKDVFGADRSRLLLHLFKLFPDRSYVAMYQKRTISAYCVMQQKVLGPFIAADMNAARALLAKISTVSLAAPLSLIIPESNSEGCRLLQEIGVRKKYCTHMIYGTKKSPQRRELVMGQISYAVG